MSYCPLSIIKSTRLNCRIPQQICMKMQNKDGSVVYTYKHTRAGYAIRNHTLFTCTAHYMQSMCQWWLARIGSLTELSRYWCLVQRAGALATYRKPALSHCSTVHALRAIPQRSDYCKAIIYWEWLLDFGTGKRIKSCAMIIV